MNYLLLLVTVSLSAFSQTPPSSHWCEDLGIEQCRVDPRSKGEATLLRTLENLDPNKFLPPELAAHVEKCRQGRVGQSLPADCGKKGPLGPAHRKVKDLMLIPKDRVSKAKLFKTGVRVIVDCNGRHLQLRGDLPLDKQLDFLKKSFGAMVIEEATQGLANALHSFNGKSEYQLCDLDITTKTRTFTVNWENSAMVQFVNWRELDKVPEDYIPEGCIPDAILGPQKSAPVQVPVLSKLAQSIASFEKNYADFEKFKCDSFLGCYPGASTGKLDEAAEAECKKQSIPTICYSLFNQTAFDNPFKKVPPEQLSNAYLELARQAESGSEKSLGLLVQGQKFDKRNKNKNQDYIKGQMLTQAELLCQKNPCGCFAGKGLKDPYLAESVKELKAQSLNSLCKTADLSACGQAGPRKNSFCDQAHPFEVPVKKKAYDDEAEDVEE